MEKVAMRLRKLLGFALASFACGLVVAQQPAPIPSEQFAKLHNMIKPQPGELRFQDIPWLLSVHEARKKAAAEGKPILVWSGSGGAPVGVC
jgi:hypothetical protein